MTTISLKYIVLIQIAIPNSQLEPKEKKQKLFLALIIFYVMPLFLN